MAYTLAAIKDWTFLLGPGWVVGWGNGLILGYLMYSRAGAATCNVARPHRRAADHRLRDRSSCSAATIRAARCTGCRGS